MKKYSDTMPRSIQELGDGNYHYNWNIHQEEVPAMVVNEEEHPAHIQYVCDYVLVIGTPTVAKIVNAVVKDTYTDDDIALMNAQHQAAAMGLDDEPEGYADYLELVATTRAAAKIAIEEWHGNQPSNDVEGEDSEAESEEETIAPEEVGSVEDMPGGETDNEE